MLEAFQSFFEDSISGTLYFPKIRLIDVIEIIILACIFYYIITWIKNTKAWILLKGVLVLVIFILFAYLFEMYTILWAVENLLPVMATALVIIFQPELRRALEQLGEKQFFTGAMVFEKKDSGRFSDETIDQIVKATFEMAKVKTGALIVVEQETKLTEYERTGIDLDCIVSKQILINIFEHNTPLHDGAILVRGNRIVSATCYLPLSGNMEISKDLGTRHRAAIGVSEVSDALVVVVSEETGNVSVAQKGNLDRNMTPERLRERLNTLQNKDVEIPTIKKIWKGWRKNDESIDQ